MNTKNNLNTTIDLNGYNVDMPYTIYSNATFSNMDILKQAIVIVELTKMNNFSFDEVKKVYKDLKKMLYEN